MQLYLIRHAIAVDSTSSVATTDGERALTEGGIQKMRKHAKALVKLGVKPDLILTSPLLRATQTAEIVGDALGCAKQITRCDVLVPGVEIRQMAEVLRQNEQVSCVAMVGHNPDFEELATFLIGGTGSDGITFKKGAICRIDIDQFSPQPRGRLIWHLTPKLLRSLS